MSLEQTNPELNCNKERREDKKRNNTKQKRRNRNLKTIPVTKKFLMKF